jgi:hypothetical protein
MSRFRKYDHVERHGHLEVEGLDVGEVYVFPKLDGTNASVWFEPGGEGAGPFVCCGSRRRTLTSGKDNARFWDWAHEQENESKFWKIMDAGDWNHWWHIYGEWLVPHTLKTYREDAWRKFYVFDVYDAHQNRYLHYEEYSPIIRDAGLEVIEPLCKIANPTEEQLRRQVDANTYLIADGAGAGEGIVLKNYEWKNRFGRQPWAKIVRNEFKEENARAFGVPERSGKFQVEAEIAERFVTGTLVQKELAKIANEYIPVEDPFDVDLDFDYQARAIEDNRPKIIPRLLQTVFHCVVTEELWAALKKYKDPTIDFKRLRQHCIMQTKKHAPDLF